MLELQGNLGIGHVRYPTAGSNGNDEAQPFYVNSPYGIVLGHNGNLINSDRLKDDMFKEDLRHINTNSDSEVLLNVLADSIEKATQKNVFRTLCLMRGIFLFARILDSPILVEFLQPNKISNCLPKLPNQQSRSRNVLAHVAPWFL